MSSPAPAPSSVSKRIKLQLKKKLEALDSVQKVYTYPAADIDGFPAAMIMSGDLDGEFSSNAENSRLFAYALTICFPVGQEYTQGQTDGERLEYAEDVINRVIDDIINTMDTDFELPDSDPSVLYMEAADAIWGTYEYEGGIAKAAVITLKVYTEVTVQ